MASRAASAVPEPLLPGYFSRELLAALESAGQELAVKEEAPESVKRVVLRVAEQVARSSDVEFEHVDPYLSNAFQRGLTVSLLGLKLGTRRERRLLRLGIEQMRQAVRDVLEGYAIRDEIPLKDRVRWLAEVLHVPQADLAGLLHTNQRQVQRWLSNVDPAEPKGDDAWRVDLVSRVVNHLRHVLTAQGVFYWFESPHPDLKGESPAELLQDPSEHAALLIRLASGARSHSAS